MLVSKWPADSVEADYDPGGVPPAEAAWLGPGDFIEVPAGTPHALYACPEHGVQFHELTLEGSEAFAIRATEFLTAEPHVRRFAMAGGP